MALRTGNTVEFHFQVLYFCLCLSVSLKVGGRKPLLTGCAADLSSLLLSSALAQALRSVALAFVPLSFHHNASDPAS